MVLFCVGVLGDFFFFFIKLFLLNYFLKYLVHIMLKLNRVYMLWNKWFKC